MSLNAFLHTGTLVRFYRNPLLPFIPLLLFLVGNIFIDYQTIAIISIATTLIITIPVMVWKSQLGLLLFIIQIIPPSLLLTCHFCFQKPLYTHSSNLMIEAFFLLYSIPLMVWRKTFKEIIERKFPNFDGLRVRNYFDTFVHIAQRLNIAFFIHIIISSIFYFGQWPINVQWEFFLYQVVAIIILIFIGLYETWQMNFCRNEFAKEVFLPIVDENGKVKGQIARSVTFASGNKYRHPVVRILFEQAGKLYLTPRGTDIPYEVGRVDLPMGGYLPFRQCIQEYVSHLLEEYPELSSLKPRLVLRYIDDNESLSRLVFLYLVQVPTDINLSTIFPEGKLWTRQCIEADLGKKYFSIPFEEEFDFIRNTVLLS